MSEHALKAIELEQLVKRFGDLTAVDDLRFTVNEGEIFGLLGPNLEPLAPLAETFRKVRSNPRRATKVAPRTRRVDPM